MAGLMPKEDPNAGMDDATKSFVANVLNTIYDEKTLPAVMQRLKAGDEPVQALADTASMVVGRVMDSAGQNGVTPSQDTLLAAGTEAIGDLANLSKEGGGHEYSDEEIQQAFLRGVDLFRVKLSQEGKLDPEDAKAKLQAFQQADQSGELEQHFPGMKEQVAKMAAKKGAAPTEGEGPAETQAEGGQEEPEDMGGNMPMPAKKPGPEFKRPGQRMKKRKRGK